MSTSVIPARQPHAARPSAAPGQGGTARQVRDLLLVLIAGLALLTTGTVGYALAGQDRDPAGNSVEAGFARDMGLHHAQGVQMAWLIRDATTDPQIRFLAYDIATTQQAQVGMLSGWLTDWGLPQSDDSRPAMAWMTDASSGTSSSGHGEMQKPAGSSHDGAAAVVTDGQTGAAVQPPVPAVLLDGPMPGMATQADLDRLAASKGRDAEVLWLQLMVAHHRGGVAMAQVAVNRIDRPAVHQLAQSIVDSQRAEVDYMLDLLTARGATA